MPSALPKMLERIFGHDTGMDYGPAPMPTGQAAGNAMGQMFNAPMPQMPERTANLGSGEDMNIPFDPDWRTNAGVYDPGRPGLGQPQNLREYGIQSGAIRPTDPLTALRPVQEWVGDQTEAATRAAWQTAQPAMMHNWVPDAVLPEPLRSARRWVNNAGENVAATLARGTAEGFVPASTSELIGETVPGVGAWRGLHGFGASWAKEGLGYAVKDAVVGAEGAQKASKLPDMLRDATMRRNTVIAQRAADAARIGDMDTAHALLQGLEFVPPRNTPLGGRYITEAPQYSPEVRAANQAAMPQGTRNLDVSEQAMRNQHTARDLETIARGGDDIVSLYHGTGTEQAQEILRGGVKLWPSGETAARWIAAKYNIPWKEMRKAALSDTIAYARETSGLSTSAARVSANWASLFKEGGEMLSGLNERLRFYLATKEYMQRNGIAKRADAEEAISKLLDEQRRGGTLNRTMSTFADEMGIPNHLPTQEGGSLLRLHLKASSIPEAWRKTAASHLKLLDGETMGQSLDAWNRDYKDIKIRPEDILDIQMVNPTMEIPGSRTALSENAGRSVAGTSGLQSTDIRAMLGPEEYPPEVLRLLGIEPPSAPGESYDSVKGMTSYEGGQAYVAGIDGKDYRFEKDFDGYRIYEGESNNLVAKGVDFDKLWEQVTGRKPSPEGSNIIDEAMNAEGSASFSYERARAAIDEIGEVRTENGVIVSNDDGSFTVLRPDPNGGFIAEAEMVPTFDEAWRKTNPGMEEGWQRAGSEINHYLNMDLEDLEYAKQQKLRNIYDPAMERDRGFQPHQRAINKAEIQPWLEDLKVVPDATPNMRNFPDSNWFHPAGTVAVHRKPDGTFAIYDQGGKYSNKAVEASTPAEAASWVEKIHNESPRSGKQTPQLSAAEEFQAYNELRQIQAAIDLKTGKHTVLSDALDNIVRNNDGVIEYLNAGFNPFPYLAQAVRKLASASNPPVGTYRGLRREVAQLGAMNIPDVAAQGTTGLSEAIRDKATQVLAPGKWFGPEGSVRRKLAGVVDPAVDMPHEINVANQAAAGTRVRLTSELNGRLQPIAEDLMAAWADNPAQYLDPVSGLVGGKPFPPSLIDYLENPDLYAGGHPDLPILARAYGVQQAMNTNDMRELFNSSVGLYTPERPNAIYVSHVRSLAKPAEIDEALDAFRSDLSSKPGIAKPRAYSSIRERMANTKTIGDWEPETDLRILADIHSRALAREAAINTFQQGAGGLTRVQVIDALHPGIRRERERLRTEINSLRARLDTATRGERTATNQAKQTQTEINRVARRSDPIETTINNLGDDYGPELSYLSGQYHELEIASHRLFDRRDELTARASARAFDKSTLGLQLDQARRDLHDLVSRYRTAGLGDYRMARGTNRYWDDANHVKAVERFSKTPEGDAVVNFLLNAADEAHAWQLGPDLSPLTIQGAMLGAFSHPLTAIREAGKMMQAWHLPDETLFGPQNVDPLMRELFEFTTSTPLTGKTPLSAEVRVRGRGLERVPGVRKLARPFNEGVDRTLLYFRYKMWENDTRALIASGLPELQAASEAWAHVGKMVPQIPGYETGRRSFLGFETPKSRWERALQTSISFTTQPYNFTRDYVAGMRNFLTKQPMTGRQKLAIRRGTTFFTMTSALAAASAAAFDDGSGRSVEQRMLDAIDPRSSHFWKVSLPGGKSVPIGGPFRRAYRGVTNIAASVYAEATGDNTRGSIQDALYSYLRTGLPNYASTPVDVAANKDFYGRAVTEGDTGSPQWFTEVGQYALEQVNITAGVPFRAVRTGEGGSPEDIAIGLMSQFGGVNLIETSPATQYRNKMVTQGIPALIQAGIIPPTDVDGKAISSLDQLGSGEYDAAQRWLAQNFPDLDAERKQYQLDREQMFALKDVERKGRDASYIPAYDGLYHELLTGARPTREILDDLARVRAEQRGKITALYDDKEYRDTINSLPDNAMRKLEDEWFNITTQVKGYTPNKPLTEDQWIEAEELQAKFLQSLDARAPGLSARFQKNLDLRDSVLDAHPIIKLKREVDSASEAYYSVGPNQRKEMLTADPELNIARWIVYGDALHSIEAADAVVHQTFRGDPNSQVAKSIIDLNLAKKDVKVELNGLNLPRSLTKDIPLWDATKTALSNYSKSDTADRTRILRAAPSLNAALVYWGASERLHTQAAVQSLDSYMQRLNWPLWTSSLKPQVMAYMQLEGDDKDRMRVQFPNLDASWGVFQNYLTGRKPTFRSEAARKEYARIMGIREGSPEYKALDLNLEPPRPQR